jgi:hypothetical protein
MIRDTYLTVDELALCDYCDQPWTNEQTAYGKLCRRHYGYVELAAVILHPERCTPSWAYSRGARLRLTS